MFSFVDKQRKDTPDGLRLGTYIKSSVAGEPYRAFLPPPLPPAPLLKLAPLQKLLVRVAEGGGRLDGARCSTGG
jgi:hypothetical protein